MEEYMPEKMYQVTAEAVILKTDKMKFRETIIKEDSIITITIIVIIYNCNSEHEVSMEKSSEKETKLRMSCASVKGNFQWVMA